MIINKNSQLGLRFVDNPTKVSYLELSKTFHNNRASVLTDKIQRFKRVIDSDELRDDTDLLTEIEDDAGILSNRIKVLFEGISILDMCEDKDSSYYYICESVYKCSELIRISDNFTGRTIKDIKLGKYTYLLGKHRMIRFICIVGGIKGFYYDDKEKTCFDWAVEMKDGKYYFDKEYSKEFTLVMRLLTFIELGDIEILLLQSGRNNGGKVNVDKLTNQSKNNVFVVDSTWNKLLIRTDGFAVRGHFRLQPCGYEMKDRKLIWIDAFEKHGYQRKPKASIRE